MLKSKKTRLATALSVGALSLGAAVPAQAQPVFTGGLVNVTITDVANNPTVQLPIGVAANVCDTTVLAIKTGGTGTCNATADAVANAPGNRSNNRNR